MAVDANGNQIIEPSNEPNRAQERITELSGKLELTAKERDEKGKLLDEVQRERDFYQGFSDVLSTTPAAKDHKEDILAKVKGGYTVEDATFAVLGKAGKLGGVKAPDPVMPAGGSAAIAPPQGGEKPISEMTQAERRAKLEKEITWS
jgi:hypothetical protein